MLVNKTTKVVVSALLLTKKGILVLKRAKNFKEIEYGKGLWDLPGGNIEFGEDIFAALNRELIEETGCAIQIETGEIDVITEILFTSKVQSFRINILIKCKAELEGIKLSEEHSDYLFINSADWLKELEFLPGVSSYLIEHIEKLLL